jgi:MFS family permease
MTQTIDLPLPSSRAGENKLVSGVCFAHFVSHYYIMLLAPLFVFVREDYGVSYTELGLAFTVWNAVSTALQTPMGFLVDRMSARHVLIAGLVVEAVAFGLAGLVHSFWFFVAMFAVAGVGNTVFHPANYSLMSQYVPPERVGRVFSFHTFSGMVGNAAAPATLVYFQSVMGWRGAFLAAAALGLFAAALLVWQGEPQIERVKHATPKKAEAGNSDRYGWRLLLSLPILLNLLFFILISMPGGGLNNYLVVTLGALYDTPLAVANSALTALLVMSAVGVLAGGILTGWTSRHGLVASTGLIVIALGCLLVGVIDFPALALILVMSGVGFFSGLVMPSRDVIVRQVTPAGAYGRVFGFVSTGFNIAGIISPIIYGQFLDRGHAREIFYFMAVCAVLSIVTVAISVSNRREA